jgi:hypothetical protein
VDRRARGGIETQQRMKGVALLVGAVRALTAFRPTEDVGGIEVEGHPGHARSPEGVALHLTQRLLELADVAQAEPAQPGARRLRRRHGEAPKELLGGVAPGRDQVIQATRPQRDRLGRRHHELRFGQPPGSALEMHVARDRLFEADHSPRFPQQFRPAIGAQRPRRRTHQDPLPTVYAHLRGASCARGIDAFDSSILPGQEALFADPRRDQPVTGGFE